MNTQGHYILPAIPPYCPEQRTLATKLKELPDGRVLLRDDTMAGGRYYIETDATSFVPAPCHPDILLTSGRIIRHTRAENGSQDAQIIGGDAMTKAEWEEYVRIRLAERGGK